MQTDPIGRRFAFAQVLVAEAGALADRYFQRLDTLTVKSKGTQDFVSEADIETELLIRKRIAEAFPEDSFFGEETGLAGEATAGGIWVVDPIDGTQPFVSGLSTWCVSIAFVHDQVLEFGLVYSPAQDEMFQGGRAVPATLNGRPIRFHPGTKLTDGMLSVGYSPRVSPDTITAVIHRLLTQGGMFHRNGSGALSLCYVACGRLIGYVEPHINSWDCLGAIAVIEAAGGKANDFLAGPDALRKGNRVVAGPPALFDTIAGLLAGLLD